MHMADALLSPSVGLTMTAISAATLAYAAKNTMKDTDIELAEIAVDDFENSEVATGIDALNNRITTIKAMNKLESALAEYLSEDTDENMRNLLTDLKNNY